MNINVVVGKYKTNYIYKILDNKSIINPLIIDNLGSNLEPNYVVKQIDNLIRLNIKEPIYISTASYFVLKQFELISFRHKLNVMLVDTDKNTSTDLSSICSECVETNLIDSSIEQYKQFMDLE
jgi:hypothetical protein